MARRIQRRQRLICSLANRVRCATEIADPAKDRNGCLLRHRSRDPERISHGSPDLAKAEGRMPAQRVADQGSDSNAKAGRPVLCEGNRQGYPPPTNKFRWCTSRLRVNPVSKIVRQCATNATVLLGTRRNESNSRDRTLERHAVQARQRFKQAGNSAVSIYAPIVDFSVADVWDAIFSLKDPECLNSEALLALYKSAGAECPTLPVDGGVSRPCGSSRFGCWTCTVVSRDRAVSAMIDQGNTDLSPLNEFRDWLAAMRDLPENRCRWRRNGAAGPGPLTLPARREVLRRLRRAERKSPWRLLTTPEEREIRRLWALDLVDKSYRE